nr:immunoglobulin light chain junction region [Macaca mulatta]MOW14917.1 immunoglobulin light chain junction region [Macaca mulatta]MOW14947.1 immunoglobulin light chain junction region [Macaca mulatta]MOW15258.1 immunoglobulin light chain junction region [Macaca mulatta]MOW15535.1 immunoglobulin light chain junction region [Macaca mulatta]
DYYCQLWDIGSDLPYIF